MSDPFIGEIRIFGCNFTPRDWAECIGSTLAINQFMALYSLIGNLYSTPSRTAFGLPDLRGRTIKGPGSSVTVGTSAGQESVTLTTQNLPPHQHSVSIPVSGNTFNPSSSVNKGYLQKTPASVGDVYQTTTVAGQLNGVSLSNEGGNRPHENRQPFLAVNYCIALQGNFPSRS